MPNPCKNGAACSNTLYTYKCQCAVGFTGDTCETAIDVNNSIKFRKNVVFMVILCNILLYLQFCASSPCLNGVCINRADKYECTCQPMWTGTRCEIKIDYCRNSPCVYGKCYDLYDNYTCVCNTGILHLKYLTIFYELNFGVLQALRVEIVISQ